VGVLVGVAVFVGKAVAVCTIIGIGATPRAQAYKKQFSACCAHQFEKFSPCKFFGVVACHCSLRFMGIVAQLLIIQAPLPV